MSRPTLKDFLSNRMGSTANRISYNIRTDGDYAHAGDDLGTDTGTGEHLLDLDNTSNGLLGDYLSYLIEASTNEFKIKPSNEKAAPSNRGDSLTLADDQGAESVFVKQGTTLAQTLSMYSDSGKFQNEQHTLQDILDKTGKDSTAHSLLKDIEGSPLDKSGKTNANKNPDTTNKVIKAIQEELRRNNRFSNTPAGDTFADQDASQKTFESGKDGQGTLSSQVEFGDYQKNLKAITIDQLKSIGASLIYKAVGFDNSDTPADSPDISDIESMAQMGDSDTNTYDSFGYLKRDASLLRAKNAKGFPAGTTGYSTRDGKGTFLPNDPEASNSKSFGSTYSPAMPFKKSSGVMAKLKAAASIIALVNAVSSFRDLLGTLFDQNKGNIGSLNSGESDDNYVSKQQRYEGSGPYNYGRNRPVLSEKIDFLMKNVLTITDYPYSDCVEMGIKVFFGEDTSSISKTKEYDFITQAHGFWLAVSSSLLKSATSAIEALSENKSYDVAEFTSQTLAATLQEVLDTPFIRFLNVAATIGDIFLKRTGGDKRISAINTTINPFNVDALPDGPGTRVSKSRAADGLNQLSLSWAQNSTPSMYMLPKNIVRAVTSLSNLSVGTNPMKGMLGSSMINNTFLSEKLDGSYNRIPQDVVKRLEDRLDAEYVPFYIHDLRTNEIISFHAFLNQLQDNYNTTWNSTPGYGRMDPVQIFGSTSRTLQVGFTLFATSKEDFNTMWYKINKLTTLFYPQWTKGTQLVGKTNNFTQPFSQVMGASPIIRIRVGDVIKSNYSKFNLARIFGIGDGDNIIADPTGEGEKAPSELGALRRAGKFMANAYKDLAAILFYAIFASPIEWVERSSLRNLASNFLPNGAINPLGSAIILNQMKSPDNPKEVAQPVAFNIEGLKTAAMDYASKNDTFNTTMSTINAKGYSKGLRALLKHTSKGYLCSDNGKTYLVNRPVNILILGHSKFKDRPSVTLGSSSTFSSSPTFKKQQRINFNPNRTIYDVMIIDLTAPIEVAFKMFKVYHEDILPSPTALFNTFVMPTFLDPRGALGLVQNVAREASIAAGIGTDLVDKIADRALPTEGKFMLAKNNPIVRAFDTTKGRGLAGALSGLSFNWLDADFNWETDWNSRAPMGCKISFQVNVIHDLPPGLDHSGYNRAPLYNVGDVMRSVAGDPHDDDGTMSEFNYKNSARSTFRTSKKTSGD